jgi:hypothetical protein
LQADFKPRTTPGIHASGICPITVLFQLQQQFYFTAFVEFHYYIDKINESGGSYSPGQFRYKGGCVWDATS